MQGEFEAEADPALPSWYWAGEFHRRELPYTAYCKMDGEHVVQFWWEPLSFKGELSLGVPCVIEKVMLTKVNHSEETGKVTFSVRAEGRHYEPEGYYDVPLGTRIKMGIMYGGLMALLVYMLWIIEAAGFLPAAQ
jgi:hypothetical protein